ncbi:alpha/beta-type small acid-soluble spore protein [Tumebacillus permanentifrigoris]|uniref:Small acid-soluble spore protein alpha/beta type n=1 Tax=Tumebacillus permanentifrigoris TaxID=378543 RepID=A0A316DCS0_9BACL|nr:alpha/beta-type small acid-soluble spore protein [Tumebacillus permanentifrigoris]PWK16011.1 small acid-soluble spore protein alpha/beta type [Tumebacillus permanentifrigoris]
MPNNRRNRAEVPGARNALDQLKTEVAAELGIPNYDQVDKGMLPSRMNGYVGGVMVRKMIEFAESAMMQSPQVLQAVEAQPGAQPNEIQAAQDSVIAAQAYLDQIGGLQAYPNGGQQQQQLH